MSYSIKWGERSVSIIYSDEIDNSQIKKAHYSLNSDERFYDCFSLILDISNCNMDAVSVDDLKFDIIGTDLGASATLQSLKVAMIAIEEQNRTKAQQYINYCREVGYPWKFRLFNSLEQANEWLNM